MSLLLSAAELLFANGETTQRTVLATSRLASVDMAKVVATLKLVDAICDGLITPTAAAASMEAIRLSPAVSVTTFVMMAAAGAAALGVVFGVLHPLILLLIALSAVIGACLRRGLSHRSGNLIVNM
jgi:uncharacterized membrane protein YjjP (DUF1212 family)